MKVNVLIFVAFTLSAAAFAQNSEPVVTDLVATLNMTKRQIIITYNLQDKEDANVEIAFKVSNDGGHTYLVNTSNAIGDVGYPVKIGNQKKIVWNYSDTLNYVDKFKVKIVADDKFIMNINDIVNQVDSQFMMNELKKITGIRSHENKKSLKHLMNVRLLIAKRFMEGGLDTYYQKVTIDGNHFQNVVGRKAGQGNEGVTYILSAHIDTEKYSPGADDNGSGIVGMLEAARILSNYNFKHSIKFIGFDGEEVGHVGSKTYVKSGIKSYEKVEGVINFDMIGYYSTRPNTQSIPDGFGLLFPEVVKNIAANDFRGDFVLNVSNTNSSDLGAKFASCAAKYAPELKVCSIEALHNGKHTPELTASDHFQFWKRGYKAIHIGDGGETRNIFLDTRKDAIERINYNFIKDIVRATISALVELAEVRHCSVTFCEVSVLEAKSN